MTVAATLNMIRKMSAKYSRNVRFRRHRTQRASSCPLPLTNAHTLPSRRGPPRLLPPTPLQNPAIRLALLCPPALPVPPHFPPSSLFNYPCPVIAPPPSLSVFPTKTPISAAPDCLSTIALHTLLRGFSITTAPDDSPSLPLVSLHRRRSRRSPTSAVHTGDLRQLPSLLRSSVLQPGQTQSRRLSSSDLLFTRPTHEVVGCRRIRRRRTDRNVSIRPLSWVLDRAAPGGSAHRWTDYLGREFCLSCRRSGPPSGSHIFGAMEKSDSAKKLCTKMRLWEFPDQYIIEPTDGILDSYLAVSRADGSMNLISELPVCSTTSSPKARSIFGIIGTLKLLVGTYLMVITECERVGSYLGHAIFKVSSLQTLPCNNSMKTSSSEQKKMEAELSTLLNAAERSHGLYFSYDVNLTLSLQRLHALDPESKLLPLWRQADPRFLWNNYMLEALIDNKLDVYALPIMQGSYQNFQSEIGKNKVDVTLIARRCTRRTGTRMWRRGADSDGYVANFVETEQILQSNGFTAAYVQVRGSMPFLWEQIVDLTYKPSFDIVRPEEAPRVTERHFMDLRKRYGSVLAVDLVNKHGSEGRLSEKFASAMQHMRSEDIQYIHFDFHRICGHIRFERLSQLYDQMKDYINKQGYFLLNPSGEKVNEQQGIVRTNCIDCLDRTNVTQSMIGRKMLEIQLCQLGIFSTGETVSAYPHFDASFKMLWANHGDDVSIQYSGTPALKGDFVRHGKRTTQGIMNDGWNALARYYFNNFADGTKQDAIDLIHGHYIVAVNRDMSFLPQKGGLESIASVRLALALILPGFLFALMSLRQAPHDSRHLLFSVIWAGLSLGILSFVRANGRMFTNRPRLLKHHR